MEFNKELFEKTISYIISNFSEIEYIEPTPDSWGEYKFRSSVCGDTIYYGDYEDDYELLILSLFHELGHKYRPDWLQKRIEMDYYIDYNISNKILPIDMYMIERQAWIDGLRFAKNIDIEFSRRAIDWAKQQLATYTTITDNCGR